LSDCKAGYKSAPKTVPLCGWGLVRL
jgi:hypothetical protein